MSAPHDITRYLEQLHEDYAYRVNQAVAEDREDLVWKLVDAYIDEALLAITTHEAAA